MTGTAPALVKALFPHVAATRDVTVRVSVSYLADQSYPDRGQWSWSYHIRVENAGAQAVQLLSRHWIITDGRGRRQEVQGDGVVGEQPIIEPGASYDYVSGVSLGTATGAMEGTYLIAIEDGSSLTARIPRFPLIGPAVLP